MPLYPFILLVAILVLVVIVPPLVAAYIDYRHQTHLEESTARSGHNSTGSGSRRRRDDQSG